MTTARSSVSPTRGLRRWQGRQTQLLAGALAAAAAAYVAWKIGQSPDQALQFTLNGLAVGAVYALLAMGFTLVYSTVWFFDLYYGAAAALGAYGVFYLRSHDFLGGQYAVNSPVVNTVFALVAAGVSGWVLHVVLYRRVRTRANPTVLLSLVGALAAGVGVYTGLLLANPEQLHVMLSPVVGVLVMAAAAVLLRRGMRRVSARADAWPLRALALAVAAAAGAAAGFLLAGAPDASLYLSWGVSCVLAGCVGLALYRGLYVYVRARATSPLIMLVASLGILLTISAFIVIVFRSAPRPLPEALGGSPWSVAGAAIKGFNVFAIGLALAGFAALWLLVKKTAFGKAVRAIGDDEEVSKVVGIDTTVVIAVVFFIGAVYAAVAGILTGHDTAIQPRMGLLLLMKGWIASVIGGLGNINGALIGGFALGLIEQFGIWDLAGEWKDVVAFVALIVFLSFWPKGLLARK